ALRQRASDGANLSTGEPIGRKHHDGALAHSPHLAAVRRCEAKVIRLRRMKTLEQLLDAWERGTLTPEDIRELKTFLSHSEARARLASELYFYGILCDALKTE